MATTKDCFWGKLSHTSLQNWFVTVVPLHSEVGQTANANLWSTLKRMLRNQNCQNYYFFYQMSKVIKDIKGGVGYTQILQKHFPQRRGGGCHPILPSFSWKNKHIILLTKTLTSGNFNLFLALFWFILGPVWSTFNLVLRKNTIFSCFRWNFPGVKVVDSP